MLFVHAVVVAGMLAPGPSAPVLTASTHGGWHPGGLTSAEVDPVGDGIAVGALVGAAGAFALTASAYARCGSGCEAPEPLPTYTVAAVVGAGIGAVTGWLIDTLRRPRAPSSRVVTVAPVVSARQTGLAVAVRF